MHILPEVFWLSGVKNKSINKDAAVSFLASLWGQVYMCDVRLDSDIDRVMEKFKAVALDENSIVRNAQSVASAMSQEAILYQDILKLYEQMEQMGLEHKAEINRLYQHPVIGRVWRFWRRFFNSEI